MMSTDRIRIVRVAAQWMIVWCCAIAVAGCGLFEPREGDPPLDADAGTPFVPANRAEGVFVNLKSGIENLKQGSNYQQSLADNFVFLPLDQDAIDPSLPPGIFDDWTLPVEMEVLRLMLSENRAATVTFNREVREDGTEFVRYRVTYELRLTSAASGAVTVYEGVAEFGVRRVSGIWYLERWQDIEKVEDRTTWGFLRGTLREKLGS